MKLHIHLTLIGLFLLGSVAGWAQQTIVSGRVIDATTKEGVPFVPVVFVGTKSATNTDLDGNFRIETFYSSDSLRVIALGYETTTKRVKQGVTSVINFELAPSAVTTTEVIVKPKDEVNPAIALVKNILRNKDINNREKLMAYEYEVYNKVEFDLNNISEKFQDRKIFKPFEFVFEGVDTTQEKPYLPVFMTESLSEYYYRRNPKVSKEIIKATKVSGVENESINQFLGDMYQNTNV
ncbi:MAG: hypothetical protein RLZZ262_2560, partial [Bacteroidota bacterium]